MREQYVVNARRRGLTTRQLQRKLAEYGWTAVITDPDEDVIQADGEIGEAVSVYAWPSDAPIAAQLRPHISPGQRFSDAPVSRKDEHALAEIIIMTGDKEELEEDLAEHRDEYTPEALAFLQDAVLFYSLDMVEGCTPQLECFYRDAAVAITLLTDGMLEDVENRECRFARELSAPTEPLSQRLPAPQARAGCLGALVGLR